VGVALLVDGYSTTSDTRNAIVTCASFVTPTKTKLYATVEAVLKNDNFVTDDGDLKNG
jgi:hypothetical protein